MSFEYDYLFKLTFLGDKGVGKTSFLLRATDDIFYETSYSTLGVDFKFRTIDHDGKTFKLKLWDGPPQSVTFFYQDTHGVFICYSIDNRNSFEHVKKWLDDVDKYAPVRVLRFLVGCKSDLSNRSVEESEGESLANRYDIPFMEISSKNSTKVEQALIKMALDIRKVAESTPASSESNSGDEKSKKCIIC